MREEILVALAAGLFAAEEDKNYSAFGSFPADQETRQLQDRDASGSVIIRAVVDAISIHRLADSHVVQVCAQHDYFTLHGVAAAWQNSDHIPGFPVFGAISEFVFA